VILQIAERIDCSSQSKAHALRVALPQVIRPQRPVRLLARTILRAFPDLQAARRGAARLVDARTFSKKRPSRLNFWWATTTR